MRRLFACHHCSHSRHLKEEVRATQINVATEVFKIFFRQQEWCSSRYHIHTQCSIDSCNSNREYCLSPGFQCPIVAKTECHGLRKLHPPSSEAPSSCKHLFPFFECPVQSRSVSTMYQSPLCQRSLTCCGLTRWRRCLRLFTISEHHVA